MSNAVLKTAVIGARGYSGLELCKLLLNHPSAKLAACFATEGGWSVEDALLDTRARGIPSFRMEDLEGRLKDFDVVFLATPNEVSLQLGPKILSQGVHVIDLSGAFRSGEDGCNYGLVPWAGIHKSNLNKPTLIANPGCYATSVLMALLPLLREKVIQEAGIVVDAKSGTTGAGRKASENLLFSEVAEDCVPYRVGRHQHVPEILRYLCAFGGFSGAESDFFFTTHLLPIRRGILSSIYCRLMPGKDSKAVAEAYAKAYNSYPLVRVREGQEGELQMSPIKAVTNTPFTNISYVVSGPKLHLFAMIDNLLKGAASQAIENLNRILGLPVETGLIVTPNYGGQRS